MASTPRALSAYRSALRATKIAFTNDIPRLTAARAKIREEMGLEKSSTNPDLTPVQRIELLEQISEFLKHNIVQGVKNGGNESRYTLNIHEETELGDNEEIKKNKSRFGSGSSSMTGGGCCGSGNIELKEKGN